MSEGGGVDGEKRTEVPVTGRVKFNKDLGLIEVVIETDDGEYSCLSWSFDLDNALDTEFCDDLKEMLNPSPLDRP